jgi:hypothetical protein
VHFYINLVDTLIPAHSGWVLEEATSISDAGNIFGYGTIKGTQHGFPLTPR